jgi:hypothetical protein
LRVVAMLRRIEHSAKGVVLCEAFSPNHTRQDTPVLGRSQVPVNSSQCSSDSGSYSVASSLRERATDYVVICRGHSLVTDLRKLRWSRKETGRAQAVASYSGSVTAR